MARRQAGAQPSADVCTQVVVERVTGGELHEQQQAPEPARRVLEVHDERVAQRVEIGERRVELARPEANAPAVERRVGAAGDDAATVHVELDPVAVTPARRVGEDVEVGLAVARVARVVPERDGHRGHRLADDELAELVDQRSALGIERLHVHAEARTRDHAGPDRQQRRSADERAAHVGPPARRLQEHAVGDVLVDPAEAVGRQW